MWRGLEGGGGGFWGGSERGAGGISGAKERHAAAPGPNRAKRVKQGRGWRSQGNDCQRNGTEDELRRIPMIMCDWCAGRVLRDP
jgi:hypothetical protein